MMRSYIKLADRLSISMGKAFSWCIVILMGGTCYEVFMAYALNAPTLWNFDFSLQMYGAIFMMAGAYTLSTEAHVRGDVIYRLFSQKTKSGKTVKTAGPKGWKPARGIMINPKNVRPYEVNNLARTIITSVTTLLALLSIFYHLSA